MKNKKGFTLVEMLVVLGIICVLALIITPAIISYRNKANNEYNDKLKDNVITVAKDYYTNNRSELPNGQIEGKYVDILTLDKMKQNNLFSNDVIDAYKNNCSSESYVVVENNRGNYDYYLCLKCGDKTYVTDESYCDFKQEGDGIAPTCELSYNDNWSNNDVTINVKSTDNVGIVNIKNNGKAIKTTYDENTKTYNANFIAKRSGSYSFEILNKYGLKTTCKTDNEIKIDKDKPRCIISKQDKTNLSMNLLVTATDDTSPIKTVKIGNSVLDSTNLYNVTKNGKYIAKVIDSAGNENTCSVDVTELDNEVPDITLSVTGGKNTATILATMTDNIGVVAYQITDKNEEPTSWTTIDSIQSISTNFIKNEAKTYYVYAKDEAGNVNYKETTLKFSQSSACDCLSWGESCSTYEGEPCTTSGGGCTSCKTCNPGTGAGGSCETNCFLNSPWGQKECAEYCSSVNINFEEHNNYILTTAKNFQYKVIQTVSCSCGCASYAPTTTTCTTYESCSSYCRTREACWLSN